LYLLQSFTCAGVKDFYGKMKAIQWDEIVPAEGYFSVHSFAVHPEVKNTMYLNQVCKDAIADFFSEKTGRRPDAGKDKVRTVLFVHWKDRQVHVYADTSGESLDKRGYRLQPFQAPVQETLAAACLLAAGWKGEGVLVNPMCGSGTLAIEAALMATQTAPGLLRGNFGFMHLQGYDARVYLNERKAAKQAVKHGGFRIIASDLHPGAVRSARQNAARAGVEDAIEFMECEFSETRDTRAGRTGCGDRKSALRRTAGRGGNAGAIVCFHRRLPQTKMQRQNGVRACRQSGAGKENQAAAEKQDPAHERQDRMQAAGV
jgi:putative N6-adenine-specific DNA methylase